VSGLNVIGLCAIGDIISSGGPSSFGISGVLAPDSPYIMAPLPASRKTHSREGRATYRECPVEFLLFCFCAII
jgi:hypothetical protein